MQGGGVSELATSPLPSRRADKLAEVLGNPCILGGRQRQERGRKIEVASLPLPSERPTSRRKGYVIPTLSGVPKQGNKISDGCFTPAFSRAHKWAEVLCNPCILGGRQRHARVKKSQLATPPLPSRRATSWRKDWVTLAFSGVANAKSAREK